MTIAIKNITIKYGHYLNTAVVFLIAAFFAHKNYFIQDDAYIAFTYARNFTEGHGLVWYPGSTEYGYTNFLYTLVTGIIMMAGIHPEYISAVLNFSAYILALWLVYQITLKSTNFRLAGFCAVLALATHHTFSAYASSGLETMVVTALVLGFYTSLIFSYVDKNPFRIWQLALLASAALLTRLDSALLLFPGYIWIAIQSGLFSSPLKCLSQKGLWVMAGIPTLAVLCLLGWAYSYYGYALPNTFYAKIPDGQSMIWLGKSFMLKYFSLHNYIPAYLAGFAALSMIWLAIRRQWQPLPPLLCLTIVIAMWLSYVVYIGGGFMEFRLLVPILPFFIIITTIPIIRIAQHSDSLQFPLHVGLGIVLITLLSSNMIYDRNQKNKGMFGFPGFIETTHHLDNWITAPNGWINTGKSLHKLLHHSDHPPVSIATTAVGSIGYYSQLPITDLHGLNSRAVLNKYKPFEYRPGRHRAPPPPRPGHTIIATDQLLESEGVNLNIFHPQTFCKQGQYYKHFHKKVRVFPYKLYRTIFIPLNKKCFVVADYRKTHPRIEKLLANGTILDYRKHSAKIRCPRWLCKVTAPRKTTK